MNYTLTILERHLDELSNCVFSVQDCEGAAYLLCGQSRTANETRLLVREVHAVADVDYRVREPNRLSIDSNSYARIAKRAIETKCSIIFVHSHPNGKAEYSQQDDKEEPELMDFFSSRIRDLAHGSLVMSGRDVFYGRLWLDGSWTSFERVRVVGRRIAVHGLGTAGGQSALAFFDRQVRAFGEENQQLLGELHAGVVGAGGTGSAVAEQLLRLGVGRLSVFDGDVLEPSNVTRVFGSTLADAGRNKAEILAAHLQRVGLSENVISFPTHISDQSVARHLRECDVVFGCTDKEAPRALLVQLALRYLIPVFDVGVKIGSSNGIIGDVVGRSTVLLPGEACLFCRERISPKRIAAEQLPPSDRDAMVAEGYAPELETSNPAVIMFTAAVAAQAVGEFMHRLTGFMGKERQSNEVLQFFSEATIRRNYQVPDAQCLCANEGTWGRGDGRDFLGVTWAS